MATNGAKMTDEKSGGIAEGIRTGFGILAAFKEAVEETLDEAIARGDLSPERARSVVRDAAEKVQMSLGDARERLDLVTRKEFEALRRETEELRRRLDRLTAKGGDGSAEAPNPGAEGIEAD
jgi:polyhydroxyalkanoate synthesis regulator phasin